MSAKTADPLVKMFEYVYQQSPSQLEGEKSLGLGHFSFLAEKLALSLEDLSIYVLAYSLGCTHVECKFDIKEHEFVDGLRAVLPKSAKIDEANQYKAAFDALRKSVLDMNAKIHQDEKELEKFYAFLYTWCLKSNKADDRTEIAVELWELFYSREQVSRDAKRFTGYVHFTNLRDWLEFIQSPLFATSRVSMDLWQQLRLFAPNTSYEKHDPDDAWPVAIDSFVDWYKAKHQNDKEKAADKKKKK